MFKIPFRCSHPCSNPQNSFKHEKINQVVFLMQRLFVLILKELNLCFEIFYLSASHFPLIHDFSSENYVRYLTKWFPIGWIWICLLFNQKFPLIFRIKLKHSNFVLKKIERTTDRKRSNALNIDWKLHGIKALIDYLIFEVDFLVSNKYWWPEKGQSNA